MRLPCFFAILCVVFCSGLTDPVDHAELNYIRKFRHLAVSEMELHGIPASITLAQALAESDAGRSILAIRANNHFGIKCKSWWTGGKYYYADDDRDESGRLVPSCFRLYDSPESSFEDHSAFLIGSERYATLFSYAKTDYKNWATGLQRCGYATDPGYAGRLIRYIERYRLFELDDPDGK